MYALLIALVRISFCVLIVPVELTILVSCIYLIFDNDTGFPFLLQQNIELALVGAFFTPHSIGFRLVVEGKFLIL